MPVPIFLSIATRPTAFLLKIGMIKEWIRIWCDILTLLPETSHRCLEKLLHHNIFAAWNVLVVSIELFYLELLIFIYLLSHWHRQHFLGRPQTLLAIGHEANELKNRDNLIEYWRWQPLAIRWQHYSSIYFSTEILSNAMMSIKASERKHQSLLGWNLLYEHQPYKSVMSNNCLHITKVSYARATQRGKLFLLLQRSCLHVF